MQAQDSLSGIALTELGQPVAELPVAHVDRSREYHRDRIGFTLGWVVPTEDGSGNEIGSVSRGEAAIFMFSTSLEIE